MLQIGMGLPSGLTLLKVKHMLPISARLKPLKSGVFGKMLALIIA
jgi:hypothetical protein